jgi:hypothetical protein
VSGEDATGRGKIGDATGRVGAVQEAEHGDPGNGNRTCKRSRGRSDELAVAAQVAEGQSQILFPNSPRHRALSTDCRFMTTLGLQLMSVLWKDVGREMSRPNGQRASDAADSVMSFREDGHRLSEELKKCAGLGCWEFHPQSDRLEGCNPKKQVTGFDVLLLPQLRLGQALDLRRRAAR